MQPIALLFSDRLRPLKLAAAAAGLALFAGGYALWSPGEGPTFAGIALEPWRWPGELVGPEHLKVQEASSEELVLIRFGPPFRFTFPGGPEGDRLRNEAARFNPGNWVSVAAVHLEGLWFEVRRLTWEPYRKWKILVSGIAVLLVAALLPVFYRWSRGALRPRGTTGEAAGTGGT